MKKSEKNFHALAPTLPLPFVFSHILTLGASLSSYLRPSSLFCNGPYTFTDTLKRYVCK